MTVRAALIMGLWLIGFVWLIARFRGESRRLERELREFDDHADQVLRIVQPPPEDRADWPPR